MDVMMDMEEAAEAVVVEPTPLEKAVTLRDLEAARLLVSRGPPGLAHIPVASGASLVLLNEAMGRRVREWKAECDAMHLVLCPAPKSAAMQ